jgi:hypothetical protein
MSSKRIEFGSAAFATSMELVTAPDAAAELMTPLGPFRT